MTSRAFDIPAGSGRAVLYVLRHAAPPGRVSVMLRTVLDVLRHLSWMSWNWTPPAPPARSAFSVNLFDTLSFLVAVLVAIAVADCALGLRVCHPSPSSPQGLAH